MHNGLCTYSAYPQASGILTWCSAGTIESCLELLDSATEDDHDTRDTHDTHNHLNDGWLIRDHGGFWSLTSRRISMARHGQLTRFTHCGVAFAKSAGLGQTLSLLKLPNIYSHDPVGLGTDSPSYDLPPIYDTLRVPPIDEVPSACFYHIVTSLIGNPSVVVLSMGLRQYHRCIVFDTSSCSTPPLVRHLLLFDTSSSRPNEHSTEVYRLYGK